MSGIRTVLGYIKESFPGDFKDARFRDVDQPFDLNSLVISDLMIMPASLNNTRLGEPVNQNNRFGHYTISKSYIAIFLFNRPIDKDKTLRSILNQLVLTPTVSVVITKVELNPQVILKRLLKNTSADPTLTVFAVWFTVNEFTTITKENCEICFSDC